MANDFKTELAAFFAGEGIGLFAPISLSDCRIINKPLLCRTLPDAQSALLYVLPYFSGWHEERNLSLYALPEDYHIYVKELNARLTAFLAKLFPNDAFYGFGDHSPIDERDAFAGAGLGILGDNGMFYTEKYGSFVFLGEVLLSVPPEKLFAKKRQSPRGCLHCGKCRDACPCHFEDCASGIGQKKGALSPEEEEKVLHTGLVWGCDTCQTVCPLNKAPEITPIPFFCRNLIKHLDEKTLETLDKEAFARRAFAWKGKKTVERNVKLFERKKPL